MSEFKRYVMEVEAIEVTKPFRKIAQQLGATLIKDGNRITGIYLGQRAEAGHRTTIGEGWFVVRGPSGLLTPVRADIFEQQYRACHQVVVEQGGEE